MEWIKRVAEIIQRNNSKKANAGRVREREKEKM